MQKKGAALRQAQDAALRAVQESSQVSLSDPGSSPGLRPAGETLPARLAFTPVPRRYRHDGWTPERQVAFIHALADTGCVDRSARMVNMAQANCYALRRAPGAEEFRRAWDAALDFGLRRLKDIAFERAIEGELVPVFAGGKLMGYRRKRNDALLMFCLRHYGQDAQGQAGDGQLFLDAGQRGGGERRRRAPLDALGTSERRGGACRGFDDDGADGDQRPGDGRDRGARKGR